MTWSVGSITVNGTSIPVQVGETAGAVFDVYKGYVDTLQDKLFHTAGAPVPPLDAGGRTAVEAAIKGLRDLMLEGMDVTIPTGPSSSVQVKRYISQDMGEQLNLLFESLKAVGVVVQNTVGTDVSFGTLQTAQFWQNLVTATAILQGLFSADSSANTRALQAMIELDYVRTGNELINDKMASLKEAVGGTQQVIDNLTSLQTLRNQIVIPNRGSFTAVTQFNWSGTNFGPADYTKVYQKAASAFYGQPVNPVLAPVANTDYLLSHVGRELFEIANAFQETHGDLSFFQYAGRARYGNDNGHSPELDGKILMDTFYFYVPRENSPPSQAFLDAFGLTYVDPNTTTANLDTHFRNLPNGDVQPPIKDTTYGINPSNPSFISHVYVSSDARIINAFKVVRDMVLGGYHYVDVNNNGVDTVAPGTGDPLSVQIMTLLNGIPTGLEANIKQLISYRDNIASLITNLSAANGNNPVDPSSLLGKLKQVLADITNTFKTTGGDQVSFTTTLLSAYSGYSNWMLDKYNLRTDAVNANQAGVFQQNINFAINAAESTNDKQALEVKRFLYVFEQFYQSASATLQAITQIIQRMAQNIGR